MPTSLAALTNLKGHIMIPDKILSLLTPIIIVGICVALAWAIIVWVKDEMSLHRRLYRFASRNAGEPVSTLIEAFGLPIDTTTFHDGDMEYIYRYAVRPYYIKNDPDHPFWLEALHVQVSTDGRITGVGTNGSVWDSENAPTPKPLPECVRQFAR